MAKRRFELTDATSNKFWEVSVEGAQMTIAFGRIGTDGSAKDKTFASPAEAEREAAKLVAEKTKKGYSEVGAAKAGTKAAAKTPAAKTPAKSAAKTAPAPKLTGPHAKPIAALLEMIHAKEKWLVSQLAPGATSDALATLRELDAPGAMLALYTAHDGTENEMFGAYRLLSIADIVAERATMNGLLAKNPTWAKDGTWNAKWIPFLADGDGQLFCVDPTGAFEEGKPAQILFYDHEIGPRREFGSFEVLVELLTNLAKAKLLDAQKQENASDKYDALYSDAKSAGLPKMSAKERKAALSPIEDSEDPPEPQAILDMLLPLVRRYSAEEDLWAQVQYAAVALEQWPLVIEAASTKMRLTRKEWKNQSVSDLFLGLHHTGRDEEAFATLRAGLARITNANENPLGLVPTKIDPAVRRKALAIVTEHPSPPTRWVEAWFARGSEAIDPAERKMSLEKAVELVKTSKNGPGSWQRFRFQAERLLAHDAAASLSPEARADALLAFAERVARDKDIADEGSMAWYEAALQAGEVGRWEVALRAGEKAMASMILEGSRYEVCHIAVRALHELGRDPKALDLLRTALTDAYGHGDGRYVAVPRHAEREAGNLERSPADAAFEAKCFALLVEMDPEDFGALKWQAAFTHGPARKAVLEQVVAFCTAAAKKDDYYGKKSLAAFADAKKDALTELGKA